MALMPMIIIVNKDTSFVLDACVGPEHAEDVREFGDPWCTNIRELENRVSRLSLSGISFYLNQYWPKLQEFSSSFLMPTMMSGRLESIANFHDLVINLHAMVDRLKHFIVADQQLPNARSYAQLAAATDEASVGAKRQRRGFAGAAGKIAKVLAAATNRLWDSWAQHRWPQVTMIHENKDLIYSWWATVTHAYIVYWSFRRCEHLAIFGDKGDSESFIDAVFKTREWSSLVFAKPGSENVFNYGAWLKNEISDGIVARHYSVSMDLERDRANHRPTLVDGLNNFNVPPPYVPANITAIKSPIARMKLGEIYDVLTFLSTEGWTRINWTSGTELCVMLLWRRYAELLYCPSSFDRAQTLQDIRLLDLETESTSAEFESKCEVLFTRQIQTIAFHYELVSLLPRINYDCVDRFGKFGNEDSVLQTADEAMLVTENDVFRISKMMIDVAEEKFVSVAFANLVEQGCYSHLLRPHEREMSVLNSPNTDRLSTSILEGQRGYDFATMADFMHQSSVDAFTRFLIKNWTDKRLADLYRKPLFTDDLKDTFDRDHVDMSGFGAELTPWIILAALFCLNPTVETENHLHVPLINPMGMLIQIDGGVDLLLQNIDAVKADQTEGHVLRFLQNYIRITNETDETDDDDVDVGADSLHSATDGDGGAASNAATSQRQSSHSRVDLFASAKTRQQVRLAKLPPSLIFTRGEYWISDPRRAAFFRTRHPIQALKWLAVAQFTNGRPLHDRLLCLVPRKVIEQRKQNEEHSRAQRRVRSPQQ